MVRPSEQLKRVVSAGPWKWEALDKLEPIMEEAVRELRDLASDPGFTGEAATSVSDYAEALRSDYLDVLRGIDAARYALERANVAYETAVRKYATFDDVDTGLLATLSSGGLNFVFDAIDDFLDGEDDDDRGEDGLQQLNMDLFQAQTEPFPSEYRTGSAPPYGGQLQPGYTGTDPNFDADDFNVPPPAPPDGSGLDQFAGAGAGLAIDGPGAGLSAGGAGGGGGGGGGAGGMHGAGVGSGLGAGSQLGGVGMLGAGAGAGATAAAAAVAAKASGKGMMGGGGGMGGGAAQEKSKRPASGLKAPELEEDADAAPRSEGAGAGGRASLPDES